MVTDIKQLSAISAELVGRAVSSNSRVTEAGTTAISDWCAISAGVQSNDEWSNNEIDYYTRGARVRIKMESGQQLTPTEIKLQQLSVTFIIGHSRSPVFLAEDSRCRQ